MGGPRPRPGLEIIHTKAGGSGLGGRGQFSLVGACWSCVTPSRKDVAYIDEPSAETTKAHEMLSDQLDEIETVVNECEKLFK